MPPAESPDLACVAVERCIAVLDAVRAEASYGFAESDPTATGRDILAQLPWGGRCHKSSTRVRGNYTEGTWTMSVTWCRSLDCATCGPRLLANAVRRVFGAWADWDDHAPLPPIYARTVTEDEWAKREQGGYWLRDFLQRHPEVFVCRVGYQGDRVLFWTSGQDGGEEVLREAVADALLRTRSRSPVSTGSASRRTRGRPLCRRRVRRSPSRTRSCCQSSILPEDAHVLGIPEGHDLYGYGSKIPSYLAMKYLAEQKLGREIPEVGSLADWKRYVAEVSGWELDLLEEAAEPLAEIRRVKVKEYRDRMAAERATEAEVLALVERVGL